MGQNSSGVRKISHASGKMLKNLSFVSLAFIYANLTGFVFHFFVSRHLGTAGYGEFMVLYSLMLTVGNFINFFANACVRELVKHRESIHAVLRYMRHVGMFLGLACLLAGFTLSAFLKSFLRVSDIHYIWVISSVWLVQFLVIIERAYLQSTESFKLLSISSAFEQTLRLIAAIVLIYAGFGVFGAVFSSFVGLFTVLVSLLVLNGHLFGELRAVPLRNLFKASLFTSPVSLFIYADDLFIRRIFEPSTAGLYASVSVIGKAFVWLVMTLMGVFFPEFVKHRHNTYLLKKLFLKSCLLIILLFLLAEFSVLIFGKKVFVLLFSNKFLPAFSLLPVYILCIMPLILALAFVFLLTALSRNLLLIYLHIFTYYAGFLILPFEDVNSYMLYIFLVNSSFALLYAFFTLFQVARDSGLSKLLISWLQGRR